MLVLLVFVFAAVAINGCAESSADPLPEYYASYWYDGVKMGNPIPTTFFSDASNGPITGFEFRWQKK